MTLSEMVHIISEKTGYPRARVKRVLKAFFTETRAVALSGEPVVLTGFGKFDAKVLKDRKLFGKNVKGRSILRFKEPQRGKVRRSD